MEESVELRLARLEEKMNTEIAEIKNIIGVSKEKRTEEPKLIFGNKDLLTTKNSLSEKEKRTEKPKLIFGNNKDLLTTTNFLPEVKFNFGGYMLEPCLKKSKHDSFTGEAEKLIKEVKFSKEIGQLWNDASSQLHDRAVERLGKKESKLFNKIYSDCDFAVRELCIKAGLHDAESSRCGNCYGGVTNQNISKRGRKIKRPDRYS